jgi:hypothetical protein
MYFCLFVSFCFTLVSKASQDSSVSKDKAKAKVEKKHENTEHNFEDLLVQGKYHFSDEAVTTVEEDKVLDALIGVRADFKDRLQKSSGLYDSTKNSGER